MAKGLLDCAHVDVHNMDGYKEYVAQNGAVFNKYGAKFLVRGGPFEAKEGSSRTRNIVLEFKNYETATGLLQFAGIPAHLVESAKARTGDRRSRDHPGL